MATPVTRAQGPPPQAIYVRGPSSQGKWVLYLLGGVAAVGGVYYLVNNLTTNPAVAACQKQLQFWSQQYAQAYDNYLKANNGQPLSQQQEQALQPLKDQMDKYTQCIISEANYDTNAVLGALSLVAIAAIGTAGGVAAARAYWNSRGIRGPRSSTELAQTVRNANVTNKVQTGEMDQPTGSANIQANQARAAADAQLEGTSLSTQAGADYQAAEGAANYTLADRISLFIQDIISLIETFVADVAAYFAELL